MTVTDFPALYAQTRRFTTGTPRTFTVVCDGSEVLFLRSKGEEDPVLCLWSMDTATGLERLVVDPNALSFGQADLPPAELARRERARESANGIVSYSVSSNELSAVSTQVCFALAGTLVVAQVGSGLVTMPTVEGPVFDPRFSPDGKMVAYVSNASLRVTNLETGVDSKVVSDDLPSSSWGAAEFIAAEEMGRNRGYWWSPDSKSLLVTRVNLERVNTWWIADPAHPEGEPNEIRYPAAGTANAVVELWHYLCPNPAERDVEAQPRQIQWDEQETYEYLADVVWPSTSAPVAVRQTRDQRTVSMAEINLSTGSLHEIREIKDDVWVELVPGSPWPHELGLVTVEDITLTDHRALCLDGDPITEVGLQVRAVLECSGAAVTFTASPDPTEIHLYRLDLASKDRTQLTAQPGVHTAAVAGETAVITSASVGAPGTTTEVNGHRISTFATTPPMAAEPQFYRFGHRRLSTAVFLPSDHDGTSTLPVLLDPYGGPHAQRVLKYHNPHLVSRWFAEQGFAVLAIDGRGTPGRGPAFERAVWGNLAAPVLEDQIDALDAAAEHFGFLDLDRVGIRGWSFGGYLAALAAIRAPERIHAAIAGAPVTAWELYDTHYTERYLGHPANYPEHYTQTNLLLEAEALNRPLLLIHGLADDNVVAAHTLQLSTALLVAGRTHQVLPLSGVTHMTPQVAVAENLLRLQLTFLKEHLS